MSIKLIGECLAVSKEVSYYVFAYDDFDWDGAQVGFVYVKGPDYEIRYHDQLVGSIENHAPYYFIEEPTTVFSQDELDRILALPVKKMR